MIHKTLPIFGMLVLLSLTITAAQEENLLHFDGPEADEGFVITEKEFNRLYDININPSTNKASSDKNVKEVSSNPSTCTQIKYAGASGSKLDIVFVPTHHYAEVGDDTKWSDDVDIFTQELHDFPQLEENMNKINIWRVDLTDLDDGCYGAGNPDKSTPVCDQERIKLLAQNCEGYDQENNDQLITIFNATSAQQIYYARASFDGFVYIPSWRPNVLVHELGHSFGKLGDEYYGSWTATTPPPYPNIAMETAPGYTCQDKWGDLMGFNGVDCFQNAAAINWYRPTNADSIMRFYYLDHFCPVSTRIINEKFSIYTTRTPKPFSSTYSMMRLPIDLD